MPGSGDSHVDEVSHLLLQPAVHHVRLGLTREASSRLPVSLKSPFSTPKMRI
jgi:hypothetical protein